VQSACSMRSAVACRCSAVNISRHMHYFLRSLSGHTTRKEAFRTCHYSARVAAANGGYVVQQLAVARAAWSYCHGHKSMSSMCHPQPSQIVESTIRIGDKYIVGTVVTVAAKDWHIQWNQGTCEEKNNRPTFSCCMCIQ
jgi:hypothetical protein